MTRKMPKMPEQFHALAGYNSEVARGLVHTSEWKARMVRLQQEFDEWEKATRAEAKE